MYDAVIHINELPASVKKHPANYEQTDFKTLH